MMKYLITVSYDGSKFEGFQKLNNKKTIQGELERVLTKINRKQVYVKGSGRTDKGAHALNQKCHFELNINIEPKQLIKASNDLIDKYIRIKDCIYVENDFHARHNTKSKTYIYKINIGEYNPITKDYILNYGYKLNIDKIKEAAKVFKGTHSFKNFVSGNRDNYNSNIYDIDIVVIDQIISIKIKGQAFYTYMVRNIVGALLEVGKEKITINELKDLLDNKTDIIFYSTIPSCGLYLVDVEY